MISRTQAQRGFAHQFVGALIFILILIALIGPVLLPFALLPETDPQGLGNGAFVVSLQREFGEAWDASHAALRATWASILATFALG